MMSGILFLLGSEYLKSLKHVKCLGASCKRKVVDYLHIVHLKSNIIHLLTILPFLTLQA
jgi:hypothetical protein